jgi:NAD(P)-dependent dehydrogenase (short-subunit alcohol dehydrogenase family)
LVHAFLNRNHAEELVEIGPATPDHVLRTKPTALFIHEPDYSDLEGLGRRIEASVQEYGKKYDAYFEEMCARKKVERKKLDPLPRVVLLPGFGMVTMGKTIGDARVVADVYEHTMTVMMDADDIGTYQPVSRSDLFDVEYWSLEQAKLKVAKSAGGPLVRRIALVTGAARGIGRATAEHFLDLGAHVMLSDSDEAALSKTSLELKKRAGTRVAAALADVTRYEACADLMTTVIATFGGLDVVVSNAGNAPSGLLHTGAGEDALRRSFELNFFGHQHVARAACDVFLAQGIGGCLLFNASKSAFNPGKEFGPYAVPKAAVVALMRQYAVDLGPQGIRANAVNADRIRTALFDGIIESRAKARGVSPDEYFRDNLLKRETTARDVALAFGHLAVAEATTGSVVTVDGGNAAAFPR